MPRQQPRWLKFDRQVLSFTGYFKESVVESPIENWRLRRVIIYYYLNDNTIYITEPKVVNSGLPQGVFLKQARVPKTVGGNDWYTWRDFNCGINMKFNEHVLRITDCDSFTRQFLTDNGIKVADAEQIPTDAYDTMTALKGMKVPPPD